MGDDGAQALPGESSLGGNIAKALFLTINVSDLDRAVEFYEATYPVTRAEIVDPPVQAFHGLGIPRGQFRARMMRDAQPFQGGAILLVQWLSPGPVGTPYPEANHLGWYREHANASSTGQNARYEAALKHGGRPYGPPSSIYITPTQHRSYAWYASVLGLELQVRLNPMRRQPQSAGSLGDMVRSPDGATYTGEYDFDAAIMVPRPDRRNGVDLLQWKVPGTYGRAYQEANHLGMINLTYQVNDVDVVYQKLLRMLPDPGQHIVAPPETWDLGRFGVRKTLNILDPDGVMFQFMEAAHPASAAP
jgi:catechol 2,3-dioxygenase-like lactoylglutathione lyase family enzyme